MKNLPSTFTSTILLGLLGIGINEAGFGEVAWEMLGCLCGAVGEAGVVSVVVFVCLSHF
jgi:hypothetical protein